MASSSSRSNKGKGKMIMLDIGDYIHPPCTIGDFNDYITFSDDEEALMHQEKKQQNILNTHENMSQRQPSQSKGRTIPSLNIFNRISQYLY